MTPGPFRPGPLLLAGLAAASTCDAQSASLAWPDYRGPGQEGHAAAAKVPLRWSETDNVRWKTAIPGQGWSTPAIANGRVWLTSATDNGQRLFVVAINADSGQLELERTLFEVDEPAPKHSLNSYASPSPVLDQERVYAHFGTFGTACLDAKTGDTLWVRDDIHCDHMVGPGSSPLLVDDLLVVPMDGGDVQYVIALDKQTGETTWRRPREQDLAARTPDERKAFSTPILIDVDNQRQLISTGADATVSYEPATGDALWFVRHRGFSMSTRPVAGHGMVYLTTGFMRPRLLAVRTGGRGDVTETHVAWSYRRNVPTMPSPLLVDHRLYMVDNSNVATCLDAISGERLWRHRLGSEHCASPLYAAGRIYYFDRDGKTVVIAPGDRYEELAVNQLEDGFMASPAVLGDALILRTRSHLYRIEDDDAATGS
ncbi:MAG: PQQ-binding-like beta-propeller repeat protein [Planctomycetota bacterium]